MKKTSGIIFAFYLLSYCSCSFVFSQSWSALGTGINGIEVRALAMYNGELYAGGNFSAAGGISVNNIARWDGSDWSPVGTGLDGPVEALCVYQGNLYTGGGFVLAGGKQVNCIARWNGASWDSVGSGMNSDVWSLCVYKGELYAGGSFMTAGNINVRSIAKWNGVSWSDVGLGMIGNSFVFTMTAVNNILYAGGDFSWAGTTPDVNSIAQWNGTKWDSLSAGLAPQIYSSCNYNGELYVGGDFSVPGLLHGIAKWDGTKWDSVGTGIGGGVVFALTEYNGSLYAGGGFSWAGKNIAKWDGSNWAPLGSGLDSGNVWCFTVDTTTNSLYVGGIFKLAGGIKANNIAKWTTLNGINELNFSSSFTIYPNPANGEFTIRNDKPLNEGCELEIYNLFGETIYHSKINRLAGSIIDISDQPDGIYILQVNSRNTTARQKIIIQK